eukprot:10878701-Prorocentrum_lima.AAC.1
MPQSPADLNMQVHDCTGADITPLWKAYNHQLSQIQMWGKGDQCPKPITALLMDPHTQVIT